MEDGHMETLNKGSFPETGEYLLWSQVHYPGYCQEQPWGGGGLPSFDYLKTDRIW